MRSNFGVNTCRTPAMSARWGSTRARHYASFDMQKRVFETILRECANRGEKILTIHSVRAVRAVLDMIEAFFPQPRGSTVLHWFLGSRSEAQRAVSLGCYFSINREMLRNDNHSALIASLPLDRLLTNRWAVCKNPRPRRAS